MKSSTKNSSSTVRNIRVICSVIFVVGIAGMIIASIAGNNVGVVNTIGGTTAVSALVLLVATMSSSNTRPEIFDEAETELIERKIAQLVKSGADEGVVREIVRRAVQLGQKS